MFPVKVALISKYISMTGFWDHLLSLLHVHLLANVDICHIFTIFNILFLLFFVKWVILQFSIVKMMIIYVLQAFVSFDSLVQMAIKNTVQKALLIV